MSIIRVKCLNPKCNENFEIYESEYQKKKKLYCCRKCRSENHWLVTPFYEKPCLNPDCKNIIKRKFIQKLEKVKYCGERCRKNHKKIIKNNTILISKCEECGDEIINKRQPCGKIVPRKTCNKCRGKVVGRKVREKIQKRIETLGAYPKWKKWYSSFVRKGTYGRSITEDKVYEYLQLRINDKIERWFPISTKSVDFYIPSKNLVVECLGDYWHMNPDRFNGNDYNKSTKRVAQDQWDRDKKRRLLIENMGYDVVELWESEINSGDYKKLDIYI